MLNYNTCLINLNLSGTTNYTNLFDTLHQKLDENNIAHNQLIKFTFFYDQKAFHNIGFMKAAFEKWGQNIPATCFIAQPPLNGSNLVVEVSYTRNSQAFITYQKYKHVHYSLVTIGTEKHLFISGAEGLDKSQTIEQQAEQSFILIEEIFAKEGYTFSDIVRQWNYIEDITMLNENTQNYQVFNDVRTKYYEKNQLVANYPAATGIGIKTGGIIMDVHAIKPVHELKRVEIANPAQIDAYKYSQNVLEGKPSEGFKQKTTPKFARAKAVINNQQACILVSGTASIEGEITIGLNQVERQTEVTIRNIDRLIKAESIKPHLPNANAQIKFAQTRVYIKNPHDVAKVRTICEQYFTSGDTIYIESDICRNDLLVEIECIATLV